MHQSLCQYTESTEALKWLNQVVWSVKGPDEIREVGLIGFQRKTRSSYKLILFLVLHMVFDKQRVSQSKWKPTDDHWHKTET